MAQKITASKIKELLKNCVGYDGDELQTSRKQAYDYYFQRPRGDELPGRSEIVSGDLSSMVEGNLAEMIEPLSNKRIAEFCAYDAGDVEQAACESDCVHEMLFKRQNGFIELTCAIKDAMMLRNGVVKVYVDERTFKQRFTRENVDPLIVTDVLDQLGDVDVHQFVPDPDSDTGTGKLSATVKKMVRKFRVEALAPENFLYPKDWHKQDLDGIPFCAERHVETRSALIERGFDKKKVDRIRKYGAISNTTQDARLPRNISTNNLMSLDNSQELVEWYECYVRLDDGTGASQLHCISISDKDILDDEDDVSLVCYATGVAIINPHTFMGISLHDKLKSTQDSTTALTRALMDNLNATNKNRTAHFDDIVEEDDLTDGRVNGSIRVKPGVVPDVRMAVAAFSVQDTSANILANLQYMRSVRSEMGGAAVDLATGQMQLNDRLGSMGLDRAYSVMERHAAFMTRIIANTLVRSMYLIAHEVLRTQWEGVISFQRGKDWIQQEPSKWRTREELLVNLGSPQGERARQAAVYEKLMEKQVGLAANGMEDILVNADGYYAAAIDWLRVNDIPNPERYLLNPKDPRSQQAFKMRALSRQQQQKKQDALMAKAVGLEQLRVALTKYTTDVDTQFKYYNAVLNAQIEEAKLTVSGVIDYLKTKASAVAAFMKGKKDDTGSEEESSTEPAEQPIADGDARGT